MQPLRFAARNLLRAGAQPPALAVGGGRGLFVARPFVLAPIPRKDRIRWRYGRPVMQPLSAVTVPESAAPSIKSFQELKLRPDLIMGLSEMGIETPTEIQAAAFEQVRSHT